MRVIKPIEAADRLKVSLKTLRRLISEGQISVIAVTGNCKGDRIEEAELERFMRSKRRNRANEAASCQSINVVTFTGSSSESTAKKLDDLLKPARGAKRKRSSVN